MGRKTKRKQATNGTHDGPQAKLNHANEDAPPAKRKKGEEWFPGKFVLLKPPIETSESEKLEDSRNGASQASQQTSTKKRKDRNKKKLNGVHHQASESTTTTEKQKNGKSKIKVETKKKENGKVEKSLLEQIYANDPSDSDEEEWNEMASDLTDDSMSDDEEVSGEWETDTDYSEGDSLEEEEYSFHGSDCESVSDDESGEDPNGDDYWSNGSDNDSDYVPNIEDKYVKPGDAVLYAAKGLDLAFGNSNESQIIEINDIAPAITEKGGEDDIPDLIDFSGNETCMTEEDTTLNVAETTVEDSLCSETEAMIQDLQITDDEDRLECTRLVESATFHDCKDNQGVVIRLMNTIHFHGILIVQALANNVQINGYTLKKGETLTATSIARADYFLNLTPVIDQDFSSSTLLSRLEKLLPDDEARRLSKHFDPQLEALVHVQQGLPDSTMEMLKSYSPHILLPNKKMLLSNSPCQSSELILSAKFFVGTENAAICAYQINEQWEHITVEAESRLVIIGGKNVGKSSLCQFYINKNVERFGKILLIDLDVGQPICSPAQTVSATLITKPIIGPGYLCKNQPEKSFVYGDKSIMIAPFKYLRCVRQLLEFCCANPDYKNIPWIVNTMGYQKGFGLQLVCLLVRILQPTDVVQIQHGIKSYNFSKILTEDVVNDFEFSFFDEDDVAGVPSRAIFTTHVLDSIVNNRQDDNNSRWISNATDKRKLAMMAQLARLLKGNQTSLNDVTPFVAPINRIRMLVIDEEYSQHEQRLNIDLLNGNLVYLCSSEETSLNSSSVLECYGIGIVRGIDKIHQKIFLLLPHEIANQLQAKVNVLAIGNIPLPAEILLKQSYNIAGNIPHVTFFKDRNASSKKYVNKRHIKDCY